MSNLVSRTELDRLGERYRQIVRRKHLLEDTLAQVDRDLSALQTDLANGCAVEVAGRELVRTLQAIRKVLGQ